jgi:hypothetical protein
MSYKPSAAAFEDIDDTGTYKPSAAAFEEEQDPMQVRDEKIREMGGFKGLAAETLLNLSNAMKSSVLFAKDLPKMVKTATKAEEERPLRPYAATGSGLLEAGKAAINAPADLNKFLSRKLDFIPDISGIIPHIPEDTGVASIFGLDEEKPEDRLYKGLGAALSLGLPGAAGKLKGIEGGTKAAKVLPKHLEAQISKERNLLDITGKRLDKFKEALDSSPQYRSAKPSTLRRTAGDLEAKIDELKPLTKIAEQTVPELPVAPDTARMKRHAKADVTQASELLSRGLREGKPVHTEGGKIALDEVETVRKAASQKFTDLRKYAAENKIQVDKSAEIDAMQGKLKDLESHYKDIPGYETDTPDVKLLQTQLKSLEKPEFIKGTDVLDTYQTLHKLAKDAYDKIYERGSSLSQTEKTALQSIAKKYEGLADDVGGVLENLGDNNALEMLGEAKGAWKEYASLYGNPTFQYLEKHKALHPSTMANLELGTRGNEFLNKIVASNPELRQAIFGQRFASRASHQKLLRPSDVHDKYLSQLPEVNDLVNAFRNAAEVENEVKATAADLKSEHKELADSITQIANEQKLRQDAIANVKKYQDLSNKRTKAADIVKRKIDKAKSRGESIKSLEAELKTLEADRAKFKNLLKTALKLAYQYGGIKSAIGR